MSYNPNNPNGQNTMANSAPVTIASNQSAVLVSSTVSNTSGASAVNIQDGGNSITIDGSITAITNALPAGTNVLGALSANQSTNIAQLAGNTISSGVGATGTGTVRVVQANDAGKTILSKGGSVNTSGNNELVPIAAGFKLKIKAFSLTTTSTAAVTCVFQTGLTTNSTTELWRVVLQAPSGVSVGANLVVPAPDYIFSTATGAALTLNLSFGQTVHYSVSYFVEV